MSPADASPQSYQFNILGGHNAQGFGNRGSYYSTNDLFDIITLSVFFSDQWPTVITTNEVCGYPGANNDQYDYLNYLLWYYGQNYTRGSYRVKYTQGEDPWCDRQLIAVYARRDAPDRAATYSHEYVADEDPLDNARKGYACVFPQIWIVQYTACSTHLSTSPGTAGLQTTEFRQQIIDPNKFFGVPMLIGGDFNLPPSDPLLTNNFYNQIGEVDFFAQYTRKPGDLTVKIDYLWYFIFPPPERLTLVHSPDFNWNYPFNGNYQSDHMILRGFVG